MNKFLAVDFGTTNTLLAAWDGENQAGYPLYLPEYSRIYEIQGEQIPVIPSLIHYSSQKRKWLGNQVLEKGLAKSDRTFRWMKRYINHRSPMYINIDGQSITPFQAGQDFLTTILLFALQQISQTDRFNPSELETAFCLPVEAFEHYENWLTGIAESVGISRYRLIDEPSAAVLGYNAHIQPGNVYMVLDIGGGTMHAAVIRIEEENTNSLARKCRVLGKAGKDIGGSTIDAWLFEEVLNRHHLTDSDQDVRPVSSAILVECERVKESLTQQQKSIFLVVDPQSGKTITTEFSREEFEVILDHHNLFYDLDHTIRLALNSAREKGYDEDSIVSVFMVGGSSQIPSIQQTVRRIFGKERVYSSHPFDAVVRGAAAFIAGVDFFDYIQHDYAIRYINPQTSQHEYRTIIKRGTPYPSQAPLTTLTVKASYDGQRQLGIAIFEIDPSRRNNPDKEFEIVFDPSGAARIMPVLPQQHESRTYFWMNEHDPTFLKADPPARKSEARFEVEFWIDHNKRLTITVKDLFTGQLTHKNFPVVKLS